MFLMKTVPTTVVLLLVTHIVNVNPACVVPSRTLPLSAFTFRPSTLQIFTGLNLTCSGFVTGWRVILTSAHPLSRVNGVYLAVFRQLTATKFQLMGITEVNHATHSNDHQQSGSTDQGSSEGVGSSHGGRTGRSQASSNNKKQPEKTVGWEVIPARPQFPVQRGDVIGLFYKRWFIPEREVAIPVAGEEFVPHGASPTFVAMKDWYDISETLQTGGVLSMSDAGIVQRLPAIQVLVNVGICGNSRIEDAEECDDMNTIDGDGCNSFCRLEKVAKEDEQRNNAWSALNVCGNGVLEAPAEECDDENRINGDGCSSRCLLEGIDGPMCGNGKREPGEMCDDGNNRDGDGCTADCRTEQLAVCGNHILEIGEQCDDGNVRNSDGCNERCLLEGIGICGDYHLDTGEECDDGNTVSGDNCSANCTKEFCGNGLRDANEECDDGNIVPGDGCSGKCKLEVCGNGILEMHEQCDDGNNAGGDGCTANCTLEICGNGILEGAEQCDDGNLKSGDGCGPGCTMESCGNGVVDFEEECDDSNMVPGDGCSSSCRREMCSNGALDNGEECDDGNFIAGDGCSPLCRLEACGNGHLDPNEECDDGNLADGDGCSSACTVLIADMAVAVAENGEQQTDPPVAAQKTTTHMMPMVDFSHVAEGETFELGVGFAQVTSTSSNAVDAPQPVYEYSTHMGMGEQGAYHHAKVNSNNIMFRHRSAQARRVAVGQQVKLMASQRPRKAVNSPPTSFRKSTGKREQSMTFEGNPEQYSPSFVEASNNNIQSDNFRQLLGQTLPMSAETTPTLPTPPSMVIPLGHDSTTPEPTTTEKIQDTPKPEKVDPKCFEAPLLGGVCRSTPEVRWFYNSMTRRCDWFYDKSCYAGANYFQTKSDCMAACGPIVDGDDDNNPPPSRN